MNETNMTVRPEDQRYTLGKTFAWGLQHVLAMYGGIIAPPLIIGTVAGLTTIEIGMLVTAALFISGLSTLLQSIGLPHIGAQLPLVQGVSFAGVVVMSSLVKEGGLPVVFGAVMVSSLIGLIITPYFSKVIRFFPPIVTGTVITVIGLSLMPVAARWAMGGNNSAADWGDTTNIGLAGVTLATILFLSWLSKALVRSAILIAMVFGTLIAIVIDKTHFSSALAGNWLAFPSVFSFGLPKFDFAAIFSMFLIVLVLLAETTAGLIAVGEVIGTEVNEERITCGLRADMLTSALSPIFNSFPQSAFAQNIGLIALTGVKSRFVVSAGGIILLLLGLLPILGRIIAAVPLPVLGGAGVVLFGSVAASGIRTLAKIDYKENMNLIIVATSLAFGMIPVVIPTFYDKFPDWVNTILHSGISATCLVAFTLNLLFNQREKNTSEQLAEV